MDQKQTHFGFQKVNWDEKQKKVDEVFHSVASKYDLMNDLMSFGIHRLWKFITIEIARIHKDDFILDLAGGSGDLTAKIVNKLDKGRVVLADINSSMLQVGRDRLFDKVIFKNVDFVQADAEDLPFQSNYFNMVFIAFGLRNVTDKSSALKSIYRILKPGGKILILEFSQPNDDWLKFIYDWYSFNLLPKIGKFIADDEKSYQYLAESIRMHPKQEELKQMIENAGFEDCNYYNLSGGIVALHVAYKY